MKILITGATGFIGKAFLKSFVRQGHNILILARSLSSLPHFERLEFIQGDLNNLGGVIPEIKAFQPEVCVHLAWEGIPDYGYEMSLQNLTQGVMLFHRLVEECGCRKIVATGSCWEYGRSFGVCREGDPVMTNSYFVWAKQALCNFGLMLAATRAISFVWLRFFYVYGPGQRAGSLIPSLVSELKNGQRPQVKAALNANDFVYVDDVVAAIGLSVKRDILTGIYNVGTGRAVPVWEVCSKLEKAMGQESHFAMELKKTALGKTADFWADTQKSRQVLGWQASIDFEQGIRKYLYPTERENQI